MPDNGKSHGSEVTKEKWSPTQEPCHLNDGFQRDAAHSIRNNIRRIAKHDAVHAGELFVDLGMDVSLGEANPDLGTYWRSISDLEFQDVLFAGDKDGSGVMSHEERSFVVGIADGNMSIYIEDLVLVENVIGKYQTGVKIIQTRFGPVTKVAH